jgi:hypothetical protein
MSAKTQRLMGAPITVLMSLVNAGDKLAIAVAKLRHLI